MKNEEFAFPLPNVQQGLSKREYAVIAAMHGLLANGGLSQDPDQLARMAIGYADETLKQLGTTQDSD